MRGFPAYAKITVPVGVISIGNLRSGDIVLGFDIDSKKLIHQKVHDVEFKGIHNTYYAQFKDNIVIPSTLLVAILDRNFNSCPIKEANECISLKEGKIKNHIFERSSHGLRQLVYSPVTDHPIIVEGVIVDC